MHATQPAPKPLKKSPLVIFGAIFLAIFAGLLSGTEKGLFGVSFYSLYDLGGKLFINALTLIVVPLVSSSIISGIARLGNDRSFGRLSIKTFSFYLGTTLLAVLTGLLFVNLIEPGLSPTVHHPILETDHVRQLKEHISYQKVPQLSELLLQIVPSNIIDAFSHGQMLGLIFFSLLFGYAISKIEKEQGQILAGFWQGIFQAMIRITHMIMKFLPLGVFCLVAKTFATTGLESLHSLVLFSLSVITGLSAFTFLVLPLILKWIGKVDPILHFRAMGPALLTAFSTSSSSATLPITMDCIEKRAGVSTRICSLVVPLGTSINMSGSALYECVAALFVAQAYGVEISYLSQFFIVLLSLITSIGVAGVPAGSLVAIIVILNAMGLPTEGIGLFLAVDRLLDMCRTTVNVFSDSCCAVLVARSEGEENVLKERNFNGKDTG